MAFIRSRLSESANILNRPRSNSPSVHGTCRNRGDNVLSATAALHTPERPGSSATSSGQTPSFYRERVDLFRPYYRSASGSTSRKSRHAKKAKIWEHQFVCLGSKTQCSPPGAIERGHLMQAGLGGKSLSFMETSDAEMLHEDLLDAFPKLRTGGGYELLRANERNTRCLDVIPPPPGGYTVEYLKGVAGQAKVYIRPLQKDLDLSPTEGEGVVSVIYELKQCVLCDPIPQSHNRSSAHKKCARAASHQSL